MRKIYNEYFQLPKQGEGNVREKVFFSRLTLSVICMVFCMAAMGFHAYAYFTFNVSSSLNVIQASTYATHVEAIDAVPVGNGSVLADRAVTYKYTLEPGQYDFTLVKQGDASTGYCRIDVIQEDSVVESFYTEQIGVVDPEGTEVLTRKVKITVEKESVVQFIGCWGTYSKTDGDPIVWETSMIHISDNGVATSTEWAVATTTTTNSLSIDVDDSSNQEETTTDSNSSQQNDTTTDGDSLQQNDTTTDSDSSQQDDATTDSDSSQQDDTTTDSDSSQQTTPTPEDTEDTSNTTGETDTPVDSDTTGN